MLSHNVTEVNINKIQYMVLLRNLLGKLGKLLFFIRIIIQGKKLGKSGQVLNDF